jgi:hypothetical protein
MKMLHRLIMSSSTYQQSSVTRVDGLEVDPDNRFLWRFRPRRLEWEAIRDSLIAVSRRLEPHSGGRPIELSPDDPKSVCRRIYLHIDRQEIPRFARYFDFPSPDFTSPQRPITTVPQQQLFFLNSPFVRRQADTLSEQITKLNISNVNRFRELNRRVFARDSTLSDHEIEQTLRAFQNEFRKYGPEKLWSVLAHAMLQSNEFIMME